MLNLKSRTKTPGVTALTAEEWHRLKARKTGTYLVVGGEEGALLAGQPRDFADAWEIFDRAVKRSGCTPDSGLRIKLVSAGGAK